MKRSHALAAIIGVIIASSFVEAHAAQGVNDQVTANYNDVTQRITSQAPVQLNAPVIITMGK